MLRSRQHIIILSVLIFSVTAFAQIVDIDYSKKPHGPVTKLYVPAYDSLRKELATLRNQIDEREFTLLSLASERDKLLDSIAMLKKTGLKTANMKIIIDSLTYEVENKIKKILVSEDTIKMINEKIISYKESLKNISDSLETESGKTNVMELFNSGFVDWFAGTGQAQAAARVLKLNIGEPQDFHLPLHIFVGTSGSFLSTYDKNENALANLLSPTGGFINISLNGLVNTPVNADYTKLDLAGQLCFKLMSGEDSIKNNVVFSNGYGNFGVFFQTGAWESEGTKNVGVCWLQAKATASYSEKSKMNQVFDSQVENFLYGFAIDGGLEIEKIVNLKIGYYRYLNDNDNEFLEKPILKLCLNYTNQK